MGINGPAGPTIGNPLKLVVTESESQVYKAENSLDYSQSALIALLDSPQHAHRESTRPQPSSS